MVNWPIEKWVGLFLSVSAVVAVLSGAIRYLFKNATHEMTTAIKQNTTATSSLTTEIARTNDVQRATQKETQQTFADIRDILADHHTRITVVEERTKDK